MVHGLWCGIDSPCSARGFSRGPQYSSIAQTASALRPEGGDYTTSARETVPLTFALKQPISCNFQLTLKM